MFERLKYTSLSPSFPDVGRARAGNSNSEKESETKEKNEEI